MLLNERIDVIKLHRMLQRGMWKDQFNALRRVRLASGLTVGQLLVMYRRHGEVAWKGGLLCFTACRT